MLQKGSSGSPPIMMVMYNNNDKDNNYNYIDIIAGNICKFAGLMRNPHILT